jgi:hypothetical protein
VIALVGIIAGVIFVVVVAGRHSSPSPASTHPSAQTESMPGGTAARPSEPSSVSPSLEPTRETSKDIQTDGSRVPAVTAPPSPWQRAWIPAFKGAKWGSLIGMLSVFRVQSDMSFGDRISMALVFSVALGFLVFIPVYLIAAIVYATKGAQST